MIAPFWYVIPLLQSIIVIFYGFWMNGRVDGWCGGITSLSREADFGTDMNCWTYRDRAHGRAIIINFHCPNEGQRTTCSTALAVRVWFLCTAGHSLCHGHIISVISWTCFSNRLSIFHNNRYRVIRHHHKRTLYWTICSWGRVPVVLLIEWRWMMMGKLLFCKGLEKFSVL